MRKLSKTEILQLQPSNTNYYIKLWKLYDPKPVLIFEGDSPLYIQRAPATRKYPERLVVIAPKEIDWAEGSANDVFDNGDVVVEEYMMEIFV